MRRDLVELDDLAIRYNLYVSQSCVLAAAVAASLWMYDWTELALLFSYPGWLPLVAAVAFALLITMVGFAMDRFLPPHWTDDGQINIRIFRGLTVGQTAMLSLVIGTVEEWLFRGVLQPLIGVVWTSLLFTLIHFRYFGKPLLLGSVFLTSCVLGLLFASTGSLIPPIVAHTLINFISALLIQKEFRRCNR
ncbi:MAG: CPBP family intramembrane metalloprotease [Brevibacillus sp.]|nr:CPBP family intramembrane metalloprotease [Brevibacillus sp.]